MEHCGPVIDVTQIPAEPPTPYMSPAQVLQILSLTVEQLDKLPPPQREELIVLQNNLMIKIKSDQLKKNLQEAPSPCNETQQETPPKPAAGAPGEPPAGAVWNTELYEVLLTEMLEDQFPFSADSLEHLLNETIGMLDAHTVTITCDPRIQDGADTLAALVAVFERMIGRPASTWSREGLNKLDVVAKDVLDMKKYGYLKEAEQREHLAMTLERCGRSTLGVCILSGMFTCANMFNYDVARRLREARGRIALFRALEEKLGVEMDHWFWSRQENATELNFMDVAMRFRVGKCGNVYPLSVLAGVGTGEFRLEYIKSSVVLAHFGAAPLAERLLKGEFSANRNKPAWYRCIKTRFDFIVNHQLTGYLVTSETDKRSAHEAAIRNFVMEIAFGRIGDVSLPEESEAQWMDTKVRIISRFQGWSEEKLLDDFLMFPLNRN